MKNAGKAWREMTAEVGDYTTPIETAGMIGVVAFQIFPSLFWTGTFGLGLLVGALIVDALAFFAALFELSAWERRQEEKRFEAWKADSAARVAAELACFEANRAARIADRERN